MINNKIYTNITDQGLEIIIHVPFKVLDDQNQQLQTLTNFDHQNRNHKYNSNHNHNTSGNRCNINTNINSTSKNNYNLINNFNIYKATIPHIHVSQKLQQYFDNLQNLNTHLIKDTNNYQIDLQKMEIRIIQRVSTNRSRSICLAYVPLILLLKNLDYQIQMDKTNNKNQNTSGNGNGNECCIVESIIDRCVDPEPLQNQQTKKLIKYLAQTINKMYNKIQQTTNIIQHKQQTSIKQQQKQQKHTKQQYQSYLQAKLNKINQQFQQKISNIIQDMLSVIDKIQQLNESVLHIPDKSIKLLDCVWQLQLDYYQKTIDIKIQRQLSKKLNEFVKNIQKQGSRKNHQQGEQYLRINENKQQKSQQSQQFVKNKVNDWVDSDYKDYKNLIINGNTIQTKNQRALIFSRIEVKNMYIFHVKIIKIKSYIGIGVIDKSYKKRLKFTDSLQNNYIILWSNGNYYDGYNQTSVPKSTNTNINTNNNNNNNNNKKVGYNEGETVTVTVNKRKGKIQWKVGNQIRNVVYCVNLGEEQIVWVPYINMNPESTIALEF